MENINLSLNLKYIINFFLKNSNNKEIRLQFEKELVELEKLKKQNSNIPNVFISEKDSNKFVAYFLAAIVAEVNIFLCNPYWQKQEWKQVFDLVNCNFILGNIDFQEIQNNLKIKNKIPYPIIAIPTGGTSGKIKFAIHTINTLAASVTGFSSYFEINNINSCCILPLYHVSGLMQFFRSFLTQGKFVSFAYKDLKQNKKPNINPQEFFISLVPTQLQFLLDNHPQWLSEFQTVLLGGAPAGKSLLQQAKECNIPLSLTYGMTETASGIVTLKPEDFLVGNTSSGQVLPHAKVEILNPENNIGIIKIFSESLCLGYYPDLSEENYLITDDLGFFDKKRYLYLIGRNSQKIITGGENVFPSEVESGILATGLVEDICVIGIPDKKWGQAVTAIFVAKDNNNTDLIREQLRSRLSFYKHPKHWIPIESLPRNQQGKINLSKVTNFAQNWLIETNR